MKLIGANSAKIRIQINHDPNPKFGLPKDLLLKSINPYAVHRNAL